ncbi:Hypothetical predicted protein [Podarcis lilfordi]|uniref:Perilipin n=2 Tax=Podarcis lilfordi TaxID=74358 RepID=A0AA35KY32_9SAUR|nr:Hypothetical predicted protein [Podarcis lilfordi]
MPFRGKGKECDISEKLQKFWKKRKKLHKLRRALAMMIYPENFTHSISSPSVTTERIMSSTKPEPSATSSETSDESLEDENVLKRVGSLPLVCSVCDLVSSNYTSIKRKSSYLQTVCGGAEKGMKTITGAAINKAQPLLTTFEPQIATANRFACRGLDTVEEKMPILQQTADQVVSGTKEIMSSKVTGAKSAMTRRLSGMVDMTRDAVQGSVRTTTSMVTGSMSLLMGTRVGQMARTSVDTMLGRSHAFIDHYLLVADEDMNETRTCSKCGLGDSGEEVQAQIRCEGYMVCLLSLLNKFQHYASMQSQRRISHTCQSLQKVTENCYAEWKAWLAALYYTVTLPLRTIYLIILFSVEELSSQFHENVPQASYALEELKMALSTLECLQDLCRRIFTRVWERMSEEENLNALLNYVSQSLPFCFFTNSCRCKTCPGSAIRALKITRSGQASRGTFSGQQESRTSFLAAATPTT